MEAQALRDDQEAQYIEEKQIADLVNEDILMTAGHKKEQLTIALNIFMHKINNYRKVVSIDNDGRAPLEYSVLLLRIMELSTKLCSIKLKYKAAKSTT